MSDGQLSLFEGSEYAPARPLLAFWSYYGAKHRASRLYPHPRHETIVEPFAGSAGYALRYSDRRVVLVDKYPLVCEMWRYLIGVSAAEVRRIPPVESVDDLPAWVPSGARVLVSFCLGFASMTPRQERSTSWQRRDGPLDGWTAAWVERVASQVDRIRHWTIIEGDYTVAPELEATWFVDPPYRNAAGARYAHSCKAIDYDELGAWCQSRPGQVIVCENVGATWLPFAPLGRRLANANQGQTVEAVWTR